MDPIIIKRRLFKDLKDHLEKKEISLIVGPRQSGKTTLMTNLKRFVEAKGEKTLFLSLDFEEDKKFFASQTSLLAKLSLEFGPQRGIVFIDEIQRKEDAGLFLKGIFDRGLPYKFVVSGSGSVELKEKVHESLLGRKLLFELSTVSFHEFAAWKLGDRYENKLREFFAVDPGEAQRLLEEYLRFGGYPRVILEETLEAKRRIINEIYRSYLEKDMAYLLRIERTEAFGSLLKVLANQIGRLLNFSELSQTLGLSLPTLKNYFWYAEKTFVIERVSPYFRNVRKEITKSPTVYFSDLGLRNYVAGVFGTAHEASEEPGFLFQNFVFLALKDALGSSGASLHHWRTKDRAEVDLVIETNGRVIPVEVKYKALKHPEIERSLRSFIDHYHPKRAFVVNKTFSGRLAVKETDVVFVPFWETHALIEG